MYCKIVLCAIWLLAVLESCHLHKSLDEIRYRFTSCGKSGRKEPSISLCESYYNTRGSPITRDKVLFRVETSNAGSFRGAQGFRVQRTTLYNITVGGAMGGRGICNIEAGRGLTWRGQVELSTELELLILVGQNGSDPCSVSHSVPICKYSPQVSEDASICTDIWNEFISNASLPYPEYSINFTGGGGGGGASMVWPRNKTDGKFFEYPIVLTGGGGGSSSVLDYSVVDRLPIPFKGVSENTSVEEKYRMLLNANETRRDFGLIDVYDAEGVRGYVNIPVPPDLIAGSGGGWSARFYTVDSVGGFLSTEENFAEGGFDCARQIEDAYEVVLDGDHGGFGAGGGQCGGGGGGGGYTGGSIFGNGNLVPGGGGYSYLTDTFEGLRNGSEYGLNNEEEGFVEIVPADCGCLHGCVVYEEENEFECICPNGTQLAPDLLHCFRDAEMEVTLHEPISIYDNRVVFTPISFEDGSFEMFSVKASLNVTKNQDALFKDDNRETICCIVFTGMADHEHTVQSDEETGYILTTETVRETDDGSVHQLAPLLEEANGGVNMSSFAKFLYAPTVVSGAFLVSTGHCTVEGMVLSVNTSTDTVNITTPVFENVDKLSVAVAVLGIEPPTSSTDAPNTQPAGISERNLILAILCSVVGALFVIVTILAFAFCCYHIKKRKNIDSAPILNANTNTIRSIGTSSLATNAAYIRYTTGQRPVSPEQNGRNVQNPMVFSYSVLHYETGYGEEEEAVASLSFSEEHFTPRHGVRAPVYDFSEFNRTRVASGSTSKQWEFPRYKLVYLSELGEGQFGKVLLMKALGIAGYPGQIPVAVKTLSSRNSQQRAMFIEEAELLRNFCHQNIVSLLGLCLQDADNDSAPLMIMEYMPFGDLLSFLKSHKPGSSTVRPTSLIEQHHFYGFAKDTARAMEFLALKKYVHRDLAARNCLVGAGLQIKIADFGLAKGVYNKDYYRVAGQAVLPVRWMAPECLLYGLFGTASDVWSYGVVLWEIVTYGAMPLEPMSTEDIIQSAEKETLVHTRPPNCPEDLFSLMVECHRHRAEDRPSFTDILKILHTDDTEHTLDVSVQV